MLQSSNKMSVLRDWSSFVSSLWNLSYFHIDAFACFSVSTLSCPDPSQLVISWPRQFLLSFWPSDNWFLHLANFCGDFYWQPYPHSGGLVSFPHRFLLVGSVLPGLFLDVNVEVPNLHSSEFSCLGKVRLPSHHVVGHHANDLTLCFNIMPLTSLRVRVRYVHMKKVHIAFINSIWEDLAHCNYF